MKRTLTGALALVALTACFHDNASPTYHGAHNKPGQGLDSTFAAPQAQSDTTGTASYGDSTGNSGGSTVPAATQAGATPAAAPPTTSAGAGGQASGSATGATSVPTGQ